MSATAFRPSCFLATKGGLIEPTFRAFRDWDLSLSQLENVNRIRETNCIGASFVGLAQGFRKDRLAAI